MNSIEIQTLQADVQALKVLTLNLIGLVNELDSGSSHTDYCMSRNCFRCEVAWGVHDIE